MEFRDAAQGPSCCPNLSFSLELYPGASTVPGISPDRNPTRPPPRTPHGQHPGCRCAPPPRPQRLLRQIYRDVHTLNRKLCLIYKCNFN